MYNHYIYVNIYKVDSNKGSDTWNAVSDLIFISIQLDRFCFPQYAEKLRYRELRNFSNVTKID